MSEKYEMPMVEEDEIPKDDFWDWREAHQVVENLKNDIDEYTEEMRWARVLCDIWLEQKRPFGWEEISIDLREGFLRLGSFFAKYDIEIKEKPTKRSDVIGEVKKDD